MLSKYSESGICYLELEDCFTPDAYYNEDGEEMQVRPKRKKTMKIVKDFADTNWYLLNCYFTQDNYIEEEGYSIPPTRIFQEIKEKL